ncbi:ADP-ribose pyrophosphatase YjhB, NUDIX family [Flavobacterium glycines]|jgi:ADP-ribose pyrophosphatase YjhB (NUDIX family)|uniref:ADP-ribose pyrophosphatase YjhB, NUDIX family n=1 Tax=Flavobacterium glycines TaxID=551990 RepID=A0A1B9DYI1_9FLAO|nr:NUDIX domain-containing protein [Flavobacterium glycines]OCB74744.1 DNA mismatch repair protein MutT [Flavobacterium glycines]GEL09276.1 DNA mismatch repair protein MutT [Flavobacterium glycines]SDJ12682.1 ADP-ribose pyrophosphatase YjhB, NUDIX family [Flavobacterium glycines]
MLNSYSSEDKVLLSVDCIIFGFDNEGLKILLIKRDFEPEKGKWSLMGGFLKKEESLNNAATRVLNHYTGLQNIYMEQLYAFSEVDRDPVDRTISVAYYALINIENHNTELIKNYHAEWFNISNMPKLIFDHDDMVAHAIRRLRYRTSTKPVGFELLPEKFTMRQLLELYEAILDKELDKRNFISKINSLDILVKLNEKDMQSSRKGSYLYMFDKEKYDAKLLNNFALNL